MKVRRVEVELVDFEQEPITRKVHKHERVYVDKDSSAGMAGMSLVRYNFIFMLQRSA